MAYKIIDVISDKNVPKWGNEKKHIAVHYLGVVGQNNKNSDAGYGAHYYIYWDGTIYQAAKHDAILWQVGTGGYYTQKHAVARNDNTIGIEMCCKCDGDTSKAGDKWYFTEETQQACVWLVKKLMSDLNIPAENVLRHYDIVNKTCPAPYVHNNKYKTSWTWEEFKAKLTTSSVNTGSTSEQAFVEKVGKLATADMKKTGILASVTTAQAILESGYGSTELAQKNVNNLFGMKCTLSGNTWKSVWDGVSKYTKQTKEQDASGNVYTVTADFRKYAKIEDSLEDHSLYLLGAKNGSKLRYDGLKGCTDYKKAIQIIKDGGYATDVKYVDKICNIIERWNLTKYDVKKTTSSTVMHHVQVGAFSVKKNAEALMKKLKKAGFDAIIVNSGGLHKVQAGAFSSKANAESMLEKLKNAGFDAFIITKGGQAVSASTPKKSVAEIAKEVIAGKWGNGADRKKKLEAAGYDAEAVQKKVNALLK